MYQTAAANQKACRGRMECSRVPVYSCFFVFQQKKEVEEKEKKWNMRKRNKAGGAGRGATGATAAQLTKTSG